MEQAEGLHLVVDLITPDQVGCDGNLTLHGQDVYVVQRHSRLRVISGQAWVTVNARDHIVHSGQSLCLEAGKDGALISPLGKSPLCFTVD